MKSLTRRQWLAATGAAGAVWSIAPAQAAVPSGADADAMILIPAGPFLMGTKPGEAEELARAHRYHVSWFDGEVPQRTVELAAFCIDKYPVTNRRYAAFVRATGYRPPHHWRGPQPPAALLEHPVVFVNRADARAFARWAGARLPTAAEWEKAARGEDGWHYPWGNDFDPLACRHDRGGDAPPVGTAPVTDHPRGASPYGVMDMAGNVAEWCDDGPGPGSAFLKGGCWLSATPFSLRSAASGHSGFDNNQLDYIGFRCVKEA